MRTPQLLEAAGLHELRPQQPQLVHELVLGGRSARPAAPTSGIILLRTVNDLSPTFSQYSSIPCAVQCVHGAGAGGRPSLGETENAYDWVGTDDQMQIVGEMMRTLMDFSRSRQNQH